MPSHTKKIIPVLALLLLTGFTTAATIQTPGDKGVVWKDSQVEDQLVAKCTKENSTIETLNIAGNDVSASGKNVSLSSEDLKSTTNFTWGSSHNVELSCTSKNETSLSESIRFFEMTFDPAPSETDKNGVGFVGSVMKDEPGSLGNRREVQLIPNLASEDLESLDSLDKSSFDYTGELFSLGEDAKFVNKNHRYSSNNQRYRHFRLFPQVNQYIAPGEKVSLSFDGGGEAVGLEKEVQVDPFVHLWSTDIINDPGRRMSYDKVKRDGYVYDLYQEYAPNSNFPESEISDGNFVLTVEQKEGDWKSNYEPVSDAFTDMSILKYSDSDSSRANYRVSLQNTQETRLSQLGYNETPYRFVLKFRYEQEGQVESYVIDRTLVDKSREKSRFSGQILDSGGNKVNANMILESPSGDTYPISVNGDFSKSLSEDLSSTDYDINAVFNRSSRPVTEVSLSDVSLESSDLGNRGISAINFDFWSNPGSVDSLDIPGVKPVNLMAVRFGYDMADDVSIGMSFDSSELDPRNLKVYECKEWNFWNTECMTDWDQIASEKEDAVVDYTSMWAEFDDVTTYETQSENTILMNAYVIGTSSNLQLQSNPTIESTELTYKEELGVSGVVVDESGNRVEDANVTLTLIGDDVTWESSAVETDSTGTFRVNEKVDVKPGNYALELRAEKMRYKPLIMGSDKSDITVNVDFKKGIEAEAPSDQEVAQGETSEVQFELTNTGQTKVENIEVSATGLKQQFIENIDAPESIENMSTRTVTIELALPEGHCSDTCFRELTAEVEGTSGGETVTASPLITMTVPVENQNTGSQDNQNQNNDQQSSNNTDQQSTEASSEQPSNDSNGITGAFTEAQRMTGNFIEQQSDLNIALGLIMIFTMILAAAVKKKQGQGNGRGDRMDDRSRPNIAGGSTGSANSRVQRPDVSSKTSPEPENEVDESGEESSEQVEEESESVDEEPEAADEGEGEEVEESEEVPDNVCDICGEEFENATGVKIHKQAMH